MGDFSARTWSYGSGAEAPRWFRKGAETIRLEDLPVSVTELPTGAGAAGDTLLSLGPARSSPG